MKIADSISPLAYAIIGYWGLIIGLITDIPVVFWCLVCLMIIDIGTGLGAAYVNGVISSAASRVGLVKKTMILMLVMASAILARVLPESYNFPAGSVVSSLFCLHEFISILENMKRAGIKYPKFLKDVAGRIVQESEGGYVKTKEVKGGTGTSKRIK